MLLDHVNMQAVATGLPGYSYRQIDDTSGEFVASDPNRPNIWVDGVSPNQHTEPRLVFKVRKLNAYQASIMPKLPQITTNFYAGPDKLAQAIKNRLMQGAIFYHETQLAWIKREIDGDVTQQNAVALLAENFGENRHLVPGPDTITLYGPAGVRTVTHKGGTVYFTVHTDNPQKIADLALYLRVMFAKSE